MGKTDMTGERFDANTALAMLKRFQRNTVDHVVRRLYTDPDQVRQFLVADEVGLGKTMVARGVIARAIEEMWDSVERIDVIYICSNGAIAAQNLNRLNVVNRDAQILPTRMTLLPLRLNGEHGLKGKKVNFVSLTPGTTFDLKSSTGIATERALILRMLGPVLQELPGAARLFQVSSGDDGWARSRMEIDLSDMDTVIASGFLNQVKHSPDIMERLTTLALAFAAPDAAANTELCRQRNALIGDLRRVLARECVSALEPDLIVLDEFQRFHDLLHGNNDAAELARMLFDFRDANGNEARTLLLSATPYRMLTLSGDDAEDGNHYDDFIEVLEFLFGLETGKAKAREIGDEMRLFRREMQMLPASRRSARLVKDRIEGRLRKIMARTERVEVTAARDAMIAEPVNVLEVQPDDLREAIEIAAVARAAAAPSTVEYWKSAPYLLSFMRDYKLKDRLKELMIVPSKELLHALSQASNSILPRASIERYEDVPLQNGRMRALESRVFEGGLGRRLWLPPSLPYSGEPEALTKALVFSSWSMVPDSVAALLSFESERQMGMRLTQQGETEAGEKRTGIVRTAFNSPFRPFVLASTSIGQEGLDFHHYCHRLFHWNLPSNPVDLEQREGRVHRYKSHAVRLNIAAEQSDSLRNGSWDGGDPWREMFDAAWMETKLTDDLQPFWLYDGPTKVERHVLALPFSREASRLAELKKSVAIYRLAFGQVPVGSFDCRSDLPRHGGITRAPRRIRVP